MSNALQIAEPIHEVAEVQPLSPDQIRGQINLVQNLMRSVMKENVHFGKIPGCGDKPALLKAGAEKLCMMFRLSPRFEITKRELADGHREYEVVCSLVALATGNLVAQGVGLCSSMESKYRWRKADRQCPHCRKEAIIKGKAEYGGGWLCFAKKGGCGAKWADGDKVIEGQVVDRATNPDIADTYNTILKMAKKRAQVDATISATAASDIFTQDLALEPEERDDFETREQPQRTNDHQQQQSNGNGTADSQEFIAFHARLVDIVDPENYGDLWEGSSANIYAFLKDRGHFKSLGFESITAVKRCHQKEKFEALLNAVEAECQKRADRFASEIPF